MTTIHRGETKFFVGEDIREPEAEITFVQSGTNRLVIDHTYVAKELRSQGVAQQLLEQVVLYARENNKYIIPLCPFAKKQMQKNEAYHDVLQNQFI